MKKLAGFILAFIALIGLASCGSKKGGTTTGGETGGSTGGKATRLDYPTVQVSGDVISWGAIDNASGYVVKVNDTENEKQTATEYTMDVPEGKYTIAVKAVGDGKNFTDSYFSEGVTYNKVLTKTTLYVLGDSTSCDYVTARDEDGKVTKMTDDTFYYPRYGFGMMLSEYFSQSLTVKNCARSGRTTVTLKADPEYTTFKTGIKSGDYALIAFGHNDEKSMTTTEYLANLEKDYVKVAKDAGATPILVTPIVRLDKNNEYSASGSYTHENTGYRDAIIKYAEENQITCIDLTDITRNIYKALGYDEAKYFHAMSSKLEDPTDGTSALLPNTDAPDGTHLNVYGAKRVAYEFAKALKGTTSALRAYVKANIAEPTKAADLVKWTNAKALPYKTPNLATYNPTQPMYQVETEGWYGSAFGYVGGDVYAYDETKPNPNRNGFWAQETSEGVYKVGQYVLKEDGSTYDDGEQKSNIKGQMNSTADGLAFVFKQISVNDNFTFTASAKVLATDNHSDAKLGSFGIMLRDDAYINQSSDDKSMNLVSNFVAANLYKKYDNSKDFNLYVNAKREGTKLTNEGGDNKISGWYNVGDTVTFTITRESQLITLTTVYKGVTYETKYLDVKFDTVDEEFMYIGMYGNRSTLVEFTNVTYTRTGTAVQA